jgi:hypothetical protein
MVVVAAHKTGRRFFFHNATKHFFFVKIYLRSCWHASAHENRLTPFNQNFLLSFHLSLISSQIEFSSIFFPFLSIKFVVSVYFSFSRAMFRSSIYFSNQSFVFEVYHILKTKISLKNEYLFY